jgi:flagellar motor switch protein FliM
MGKPELTREEISLLTEGLGIDPLSLTTDSISKEDRLAILQGRIRKPTSEASKSADTPRALKCWQDTGDALSEQFTARFGMASSVRIDRFDRATVAQFLLSRLATASLFRWETPDGQQPWWLSMDASLVFPMLEHLLGAPLAPTGDVQRVMTDVERRLATRVVQPCQTAIANVWPEFDCETQPILGSNTESCTSPGQIGSCEFTARIGPIQGQIALAVPWHCMNATRLTEVSVGGADEAAASLSVILARAKIMREELTGLEVGDIISTDQKHDQPLQVEVDGQVQFLARPGTQDGKKAIRID